MSTRTPMRMPTYDSVLAMENVASNEDDRRCSLRLWYGGYTTRWLVVTDTAPDNNHPIYLYEEVTGRNREPVTRDRARELINLEWEDHL